MEREFIQKLEDCPIIAAVKDDEGLGKCLESECEIVFILYGDLCSIGELVEQIKDQGKIALVHMDLINGLSNRDVSVDYIKQTTKADGIISTRPTQIRRAKELGLYTVHRFFVIDSLAYDNIKKQCAQNRPDCIEILPGVMPKVIKKICKAERTAVIAGGLIEDREDVMAALDAGVVSISTTKQELWFI